MVRKYHEEEIPAVYSVENLPHHEKREGVTQQYFRGMNTFVGFTTFDGADPSEPHSHPWEQINFVVDGECQFQVGEDVVEVSEGDLFLIPPDVPHGASSLNSTCTICFISPLREDYARFTDYQTEFETFDE